MSQFIRTGSRVLASSSARVTSHAIKGSSPSPSAILVNSVAVNRPSLSPSLSRHVPARAVQVQSTRGMADLIKTFKENVKRAMKEKEMQDQISELKKTDAAKITKKTAEVVGQVHSGISDGVKRVLESEAAQKSFEVASKVAESAMHAAGKVSETTSKVVGDNPVVQKVSDSVRFVGREIFEARPNSNHYRPPGKKKKPEEMDMSNVDINTTEGQVVLHKDSKWYSQWANFKDNNPIVQGIFAFKHKYDESENVVVRALRSMTERITETTSGLFAETETAQVLGEILTVDPKFNKEEFIKDCEYEIFPQILAAFMKGDLETLRAWCHDATYNILEAYINQRRALGLVHHTKILDMRHVDLALCKMMDQGPVLIFTFMTQQTVVVKDLKGNVVSGKEDDIYNAHYVIALCRDQTIYDPKSAWRVLEMGIQSSHGM